MPIRSSVFNEQDSTSDSTDNGLVAPQPPCFRCERRQIECIVVKGKSSKCQACVDTHYKCSLLPPQQRDMGKGVKKPIIGNLSRKSVHRSGSSTILENKKIEIRDAQHRAHHRVISPNSTASQTPTCNPPSTSTKPHTLDPITHGRQAVLDNNSQVRRPKQQHYEPAPHLVNAVQFMAQAVLEISKHYGADRKFLKNMKETTVLRGNAARMDVDD